MRSGDHDDVRLRDDELLVGERGPRRRTLRNDVAQVRETQQIVDVRPGSGRIEWRFADRHERRARRTMRRPRRDRRQLARDPRVQRMGCGDASGERAQTVDRGQVFGEIVERDDLDAAAGAREVGEDRRLVRDPDDEVGMQREDFLAVHLRQRTDVRQPRRGGRAIRECVDRNHVRSRADREQIFGERRCQRDDAQRNGGGQQDHRSVCVLRRERSW